MPGRSPSFVVVGLCLIIFLLGFFHMSSSRQNIELQQSVTVFEDRIRSLALKHEDVSKQLETLNRRNHELEDEKLSVQKRLEQKDEELRNSEKKNTEHETRARGLQRDNHALEEQIKELENITKVLSARKSVIEQLGDDLAQKKPVNAEQMIELREVMAKNGIDLDGAGKQKRDLSRNAGAQSNDPADLKSSDEGNAQANQKNTADESQHVNNQPVINPAKNLLNSANGSLYGNGTLKN